MTTPRIASERWDKNYDAWAHARVVDFYATKRQTPHELYESERAILEPVITRCRSVLDVGCAAGGLSEALRLLNPQLRYVGVDAVPAMIAQARWRHPGVQFEVSDGSRLSFPDGAFDQVLCTSVLHHNPDYERMIAELYRVARHGCVLDLPRLVIEPDAFDPATSYMVLDERFAGDGSPSEETRSTIVPYVLANPRPLFEWLLSLEPRPSGIAAVGYDGQPSPSVVIPIRPVCFCVIYVAKGNAATRRTSLLLDLPEPFAAELQIEGVQRVPGRRDAFPGFLSTIAGA
jgi:SAM-dependent methyltransferase